MDSISTKNYWPGAIAAISKTNATSRSGVISDALEHYIAVINMADRTI